MTRVKICGLTRVEDVLLATHAGADAVGFVLAPSPRQIGLELCRDLAALVPPFVQTVGVFVDPSPAELREAVAATGIQLVQLHGDETPDLVDWIDRPVLKRLRVGPEDDPRSIAERAAPWGDRPLLLDPGGGTGEAFDWDLARIPGRHVVVAGGLNPDNVAEAVATARPWGVDVASGVELEPGVKDERAVRAFVRAVRESDEQADSGVPA